MSDLREKIANFLVGELLEEPRRDCGWMADRILAVVEPEIRAAALEEAARVADAEYARASRWGDTSQPVRAATWRIAENIRALKDKPS